MTLFHRFSTICLMVSVLSCTFSCEKAEQNKPDEKEKTVETETPVIQASAFTLQAKAGTYVLPVTVEHPAEGVSLEAALAAEADWITVGAPTSAGVPLTVKDNLSAERAISLSLSYKGAKSVSVELTQPQWTFPEFGIAISDIGPFGATFTITRNTGYSGGYFFEVLDKVSFDKYMEGETNEIGSFAWGDALYQSDVKYLNNLAQQHGHPLNQLFGMLGSMYSTEAKTEIPYNSLSVNTEYVFIVYGMEATNEAKRKTPICVYEFQTIYNASSKISFTGKTKTVTESYAEFEVTPSNNSEYWYLDWVSEIQLKSSSLAEVMQSSINTAKSYLSKYKAEEILCKGKESVTAMELMPGTKYSVVAWGMDLDMKATTAPVEVFSFTTLDYAIVDDCDFTIEPLTIEDMDIKVRVTPTNPDTRYYVAFVAKSLMENYTDEQAAQRIINMEASRIDQHYYDVENLSWANLPGLLPGVREIWGRKDEGWTFQPNHDYRIYVFGIDNFGIRSTRVKSLDVTTASPTSSKNTFSVDILSNTWLGVDFKVTPSVADEYWLSFMAEKSDIDTYFRNADGSLKEAALFEWVEEEYEDEISQRACRGTQTLHEHATPGTDYVLLVFGYAGTYTTKMYEWNISVPVPPLGKSTADFSYTYELFRGEDLTALDPIQFPAVDFAGDCVMVVRLTPTDNAKHWYFGCWPPKENYRDQGGIYYLMSLDMNPDVPGSAMQDKKAFRNRPWWYGAGSGTADKKEPWQDDEGNLMNYYPWTLSGWAEDADGNYGPWHYDYLIPVKVPKGQETGAYEVGYTEAYNFWSTPAQVPNMMIYRVSDGKTLK